MDIGLHIASFTWPDAPQSIRPTLAAIGKAADDGGFRSLHVMDHFFQMDQYFPAEEPMLEGYTALGYLAGITSRVQLALLVGGVTYRHPGLLAKTVATLDVLSGGRAEMGIGAAWYEREHRGLGVPFPSTSERFERLEETLQICLQMWSDETGPYDGTHYQLAETLSEPPTIARPHPPIMIGGSGERKTLRMVAQYADATNLFAGAPDEAKHKLEVLRQHCENLGTDYDHIRKTWLYSGATLFGGDVDAFIEEMAGYAAVGMQHVMVMPIGPEPMALIEQLAIRAIPALAAL